jgi:hypothetical protein
MIEFIVGSVVQNKKKALVESLNKFIDVTQAEVTKGVNPGGYYEATWTRDAAFILEDQFLSGHFQPVLQQIILIWSNQITIGPSLSFLYCTSRKKPLLYGRGSPELGFKPVIANDSIRRKFIGALPTTIYYDNGFCEVYGQNPDIDSTALMISTTAKILSNLIGLKDNTNAEPTITLLLNERMDNRKGETPFSRASLSDIINFLVPCMLKATMYLQKRDTDHDGLLEQKHNEDWMDTLLRTGKVVYSQACWILALKNLSNLLRKIENNKEAKRVEEMTNRAIGAVEDKMWSTEDNCYIDLLDADLHLDAKMHNRLITQDISLYLVALTEEDYNLNYRRREDIIVRDDSKYKSYTKNINLEMYRRALSTLEVLKERSWKDSLPLVTETHVTKTGPWFLEPHEYHNHTFWAWITGIEMLARSRFDKMNDCINILSKFFTDNTVHSDMLHEWVNPITLQGSGARPFRTGISSIRIAAIELLRGTKYNIVTSSGYKQ